MTTNLLCLPDSYYKAPLVHGFSDDFNELVTGDRWTSIAADTGASVAMTDAVGGRVALVTGATDNNEAYIHTTSELFLPAANKPILVRAQLQFAEANTDDANVIFGLINAAAANDLQDNGAGPRASYDGAVFYKVDGGTRWQVESSNAGTQVTTDTEYTAGGAGS